MRANDTAAFLRRLRDAYGPDYDAGRGRVFEGYRGSGHWQNRWRWRQSAEGICLAFEHYYGIHPASALELGCGTGAMTAELRARGVEAYGLDWGNNIQHTGSVVGDVLAIPFRQRFPLVVALDVFEHIPADLQCRLFEELRRVAALAVIVTVPTEEPHFELTSAAGLRNHYISATPEVWREHFAVQGFEVVAEGSELARFGVPFAWGDTNYPFLLRRSHEATSH